MGFKEILHFSFGINTVRKPSCRAEADKRRLVGAVGFEPTTSCSQSRRAARLRHAPTFGDITIGGSGENRVC
jgi:hypothetical protein